MRQHLALILVEEEMNCATQEFGKFASSHEGYAIIKEELDELWDAIKDKQAGVFQQATEARQIAAMAVRFLVDLC